MALPVDPERNPGQIRRALEWFFTRPRVAGAGNLDIIAWWEIRRVPYNAFLVVLGVPSFVLFLTFIVAAGDDWFEPLALFAAPFLYNFCYTAGWVCELLLRAIGVHDSGPTLMKLGIGLTALLITFPAVSWGMVALVRTLAG